MVRGRFAPSPTGPLHLGSLVAAVGSFLEARCHGGEWLVRIEDVDGPRTRPGAADLILRTLERYALLWDGPVLYQSQRGDLYRAALENLLDAGLAYPCTCTRRTLAVYPRSSDGSPIYPGHCRRNPEPSARASAIRLRVNDQPIVFCDTVQGPCQHILERDSGDFVIRRADGCFTYQLAVVVDDADQGINQVVRGSDLLDSTSRQIYLQGLLGFPSLAYAHLPIVVDHTGQKLSKQTGAPSLDVAQPTPTLWAALAFLGQEPPTDLQRESPQTLLAWACAHWRLQRVPARSAQPWPAAALPGNLASHNE